MIVCKTVLQCAVSAILPQIAKMNSERGVCGCVYEGACVCVCLVSLLLDSQFFAILCVFFSSGFLFDENFINCDSEVRSHKPTPLAPPFCNPDKTETIKTRAMFNFSLLYRAHWRAVGAMSATSLRSHISNISIVYQHIYMLYVYIYIWVFI